MDASMHLHFYFYVLRAMALMRRSGVWHSPPATARCDNIPCWCSLNWSAHIGFLFIHLGLLHILASFSIRLNDKQTNFLCSFDLNFLYIIGAHFYTLLGHISIYCWSSYLCTSTKFYTLLEHTSMHCWYTILYIVLYIVGIHCWNIF
jgi:hypothetical protein